MPAAAFVPDHLRFRHVYRPATVVALSMLAAVCYAIATVLQQRSAVRQPGHLSMRAGLLLRLVRQPLWLLGNVADALGFVFQFLALRRGSLALVETLMVSGLVFALLFGAGLNHRSLRPEEWTSAAVVVAGLGLFLAVSRPGPGHPRASAEAWVALAAMTAVVAAAAAVLARGSARRRAVALAAGGGFVYGFASAVTERTGHALNRGVLHVLATWAPYTLIVAALIGMLLVQSAFNAGELRFSLPTLTVVQPLVAIAIGQIMFNEKIASSGLARVGETAGLLLMIAGVFALTQASTLIGTTAT